MMFIIEKFIHLFFQTFLVISFSNIVLIYSQVFNRCSVLNIFIENVDILCCHVSVIMSAQANDVNRGSSRSVKGTVKAETVQKWCTRFDKEFRTISWLDYSTEKEKDINIVTKLKCKVCKKFEERMLSCRNFSDKWVVGTNSEKHQVFENMLLQTSMSMP